MLLYPSVVRKLSFQHGDIFFRGLLLIYLSSRNHAVSAAPSATVNQTASQLSDQIATVVHTTPLEPRAAGNSTFPEQPIQNITYRFIGSGISEANASFRSAVQDSFTRINPNVSLEFNFRPSVAAPILGPDGPDGMAHSKASAPTPGLAGAGRRLLQQNLTSNKQLFENRNDVWQGIDVEITVLGGKNSGILDVRPPAALSGYFVTQLLQNGIQVVPVPINISTSSSLLAVTQAPPVYVLGTVIQMTGSQFFPFSLQTQNSIYLALNGLLGGQGNFLFNQIVAVWQSAPDGVTGVARIAVRTYTSSEYDTMDQVAGTDVAKSFTDLAQGLGLQFTVTVVSSRKLGTQAQELSGASGFAVDPTAAALAVTAPTPDRSGSLSGGTIAGIVVGAVAGAALALTAVALFATCRKKQRRSRRAGHVQGAVVGKFTTSSSSALDPMFDSCVTGPSGSSSLTPGGSGYHSPTSTTFSARSLPMLTTNYASSLGEAWLIDPSNLAVCLQPDGKEWVLGTGSFGVVYKGVKGGVQPVAIKQMITPGDAHLRMFAKELALLRHLSYDRNLVQFYGAVIAESNLMLVLELMDGGDLREALSKDENMQLGWYGQGGHILCDIARGLHFLHSNKIAHRDLKTKNCLLNSAGEAKIADVGLAQLVGSQLLSTMETAGTFAYAAPELLMGEHCDTRADLFSFGVVMWEVVTHETPVRGYLRTIDSPAEAPLEVAQLIEMCLQRKPERRPSARTIFEVLTDLLPANSTHRAALSANAHSNSLGTEGHVCSTVPEESSGSFQSYQPSDRMD